MDLLAISELQPKNPAHRLALESFCQRCAELGIENNASIKNLKIEAFKDRHLKFWTTRDSRTDAIVGIAGAHELPEIGAGFYRVLFRGCILPQYRGIGAPGLNKNHFGSYLFKNVTPLQIAWARSLGGQRFVITTNCEVQRGARATDRLFHLMEKQGYVKKIKEDESLFSVRQNVWELSDKLLAAMAASV
ncbi:MAG TPA: hypothetical protein PKC28_11935 [Bdellovibrionales bacterium]|nr:hypothetical protein [Bdellovibrionales bacterium]